MLKRAFVKKIKVLLYLLCLLVKPLRLLISLISKFIRLAHIQPRIDPLASRNAYPYTKIKSVLRFSPKKPIPEFAAEYLESFNDQK